MRSKQVRLSRVLGFLRVLLGKRKTQGPRPDSSTTLLRGVLGFLRVLAARHRLRAAHGASQLPCFGRGLPLACCSRTLRGSVPAVWCAQTWTVLGKEAHRTGRRPAATSVARRYRSIRFSPQHRATSGNSEETLCLRGVCPLDASWPRQDAGNARLSIRGNDLTVTLQRLAMCVLGRETGTPSKYPSPHRRAVVDGRRRKMMSL